MVFYEWNSCVRVSAMATTKTGMVVEGKLDALVSTFDSTLLVALSCAALALHYLWSTGSPPYAAGTASLIFGFKWYSQRAEKAARARRAAKVD